MKYRSDIEGLRGVAVALVLLFHFRVPHMGNGFLGVDIFFVISGYLITQILLRGFEDGSFSLIGFYRRRVVRILPALLAMILLTTIAAVFVLLPVEIHAMARSGAAASGSVSNIFFWSATGYFDRAQIRPLLHTWSLGVEEQFYLLYPLLLFAAWRWARGRLVLLLWIATVASLALRWLLTLYHPDAAFYLLPSRAWQLGLGALAAAGGLPAIRTARTRTVLAGAGLAAMLAVVLLPLPGVLAGQMRPVIAPIACVAAALLLAYGAETRAARLLSLPPLTWTGRISYSLYLWHYPVLVLYWAGFDPRPGPVVMALLALASVALAILSYRFIETPFRERFRDKGDPRRIVAGGVAACVAVALAGLALAWAAPIMRPLPGEVARVADYTSYRGSATFNYQFGPVECYGATRSYDAAHCLVPDPARRNILVLGDSYAAHLWRAVAERFPGDRVMLAASGGCRPLIGGGGLRLCREMVREVMAGPIASRRVQAVVLAAHWAPGELALLAPTVRAIEAQGIAVTVVGPVMGYAQPVPRVAALALLRHDPRLATAEQLRGPGRLDSRMRAIAESAGAHYYSLYDRECPAGQCRLLTRDGAPFHFDDAHLTLAGARELVEGMPRP